MRPIKLGILILPLVLTVNCPSTQAMRADIFTGQPNCKPKAEQIKDIEALVNSVCVLDGQSAHVCKDTAQVKDQKDGKVISEKKIEKPLEHAVQTVIAKDAKSNSNPQVHIVTDEGEIQNFNSTTRELQTLKLESVLTKLNESGKLTGTLADYAKSHSLGEHISELSREAKFSDDGQYLILSHGNKNEQTRISLKSIFPSSEPENSAPSKFKPEQARILDAFYESENQARRLLPQCPKNLKREQSINFFHTDCIDDDAPMPFPNPTPHNFSGNSFVDNSQEGTHGFPASFFNRFAPFLNNYAASMARRIANQIQTFAKSYIPIIPLPFTSSPGLIDQSSSSTDLTNVASPRESSDSRLRIANLELGANARSLNMGREGGISIKNDDRKSFQSDDAVRLADRLLSKLPIQSHLRTLEGLRRNLESKSPSDLLHPSMTSIQLKTPAELASQIEDEMRAKEQLDKLQDLVRATNTKDSSPQRHSRFSYSFEKQEFIYSQRRRRSKASLIF